MKSLAALVVAGLMASDLAAQCSDCFQSSFSLAFRGYLSQGTQSLLDLGSADFDGDGFPDIVIATGEGMAFRRGSGAGIFEDPVAYASKSSTTIAIGDFNGDGSPDVVTGGFHVTVFVGNGDGTFQPGVVYDTPFDAGARAVVTSDFDGDGVLDLAAALASPNEIVLYRGNGDGTFEVGSETPAPSLGFLSAADFNLDGRQDLAASTGVGTFVLLGDGLGGFSEPVVSDGTGSSFTPGDFNRDGFPDLAAGNFDSVVILLGNGDGSFTPGESYPVGASPLYGATGDFNLDGLLDLVVSVVQDGNIVVLPGLGDGTFGPPTVTPAGDQLGPLVVRDLDGSGRPDVAVASVSLVVLLSDDSGAFPTPTLYSAGGTSPLTPPAIALGDFTGGGGHMDIAVGNADPNVAFLPGDGAGSFGAPILVPLTSTPRWLATGSFHTTSGLDVAVSTDAGIEVVLSNGDSTFEALPPFGQAGGNIASGDFDGDGETDLVAVSGVFNIYLGDGDGTFTDGPPGPGDLGGDAVATGHFDSGTTLDLVVSSASEVTILLGNGDGSFTEGFNYSNPSPSFTKVAAGDFDGDGSTDVVVTHFAGDVAINVELYWGNGDGTLETPPVGLEGGFFPTDVLAADYNSDGLPEIVVHGYQEFRIFAFHEDRTFEESVWISPLLGGYSASGDVQNDGKIDLAVSGAFPNRVAVLLNSICIPSRLALATQPSSCDVPGAPFPTQPVLRILDDGGNVTTCATGDVSVALVSGKGTPGATLGGATSLPVADGEVSFTDLSIDLAGRDYVLAFSNAVGTTFSRPLTQGLGVLVTGPAAFCSGAPGTYRTAAGGYDRYEWTLDGAPISRAETVTLAGISPGPHTLELTVFENGCSATDEVTVTAEVSPGPPVIIAPASVRVGDTDILAAATFHSGSVYTWSIFGGTITSGQGTSQIRFDAGAPGLTMLLRVVETTSSGCDSPESAELVQVDFADIGASPFREDIDTIARLGITGGCGGGNYCPANAVTRAQMAVFLLKAAHGSGFVPPPAFGIFLDVPPGSFAADWIEELFAEGIAAGCGSQNYCPDAPVTRAQMAVFLLKTEHGSDFVPPACVGIFGDVECSPSPAFAVDWIERLYGEGVTAGCSQSPLLYCPNSSVNRGQMATFLVRTLNLQ